MHYEAPNSIKILKYFVLKLCVTELNSKLNGSFSASELIWDVVCHCNKRTDCGRSRIGYFRKYINLCNILATRYRLVAQSIKLSGLGFSPTCTYNPYVGRESGKNKRSSNSSMNPTGRQEVVQGAFFWDSPNSGPIFSTVLVPQLQLWHLHRLATVHSMDDPVFANGVGVTLSVSWKSYSYHRNALASEV